MWYWGAHALQHLGRVIIVGGEPRAVRRLGFTPASTLARRARDGRRRRRPRPHDHPPPQPADPHGRRDVKAGPLAAGASAACRSRYRAPTVPDGVEPPPPEPASSAPTTTPTGPGASRPASPALVLVEARHAPGGRRARRARAATASTASTASTTARSIFAANHHSHLDTPVLLTSIPEPWRHKVVRRRGRRLLLPHPRHRRPPRPSSSAPSRSSAPKVSRRSADQAAALIDDGWSMLIFPEGGRCPTAGASRSAAAPPTCRSRCGVPVVPVHLEGTGRILRKGAKRPDAGRTSASPSARRCARARARTPAASPPASRRAVAALADEATTDWWQARQRAADGHHAGAHRSRRAPAWRRAWALGDRSRKRRRQTRAWPKL